MRSCLLLLFLLAAAPARADDVPRWGHLRLQTAAPMDTTAWNRALDLEGKPLDEAPLEPALLRGLRELAREGYPFAVARPGNLDLEGGRITGTIRVDPGVRPRIRAVSLEGAKVTTPGTALRLSGLEKGQVYTGVETRQVQERLSRSGLFSRVGDPKLLPGEDPQSIVVEVPVEEPPYTRFRGVLGVSGKESQLTGLVDLDLRNIAGSARRAAGSWENRGDGLTRFSLFYREPWLPLVPIGIEGSLSHDVNEDVYSFTKWEISGDLTLAAQWTLRAGRGGSRAVQPGSETGSEREAFYLGGIALERRNSVLNPTRGFRISLESRRGKKTYIPYGDSVEVRVDRTRWQVEAEGYQRVGKQWLAALRTRFQYLDSPEDSIPRWDLFAVGGAATLRGYREEQFLTPGSWIFQGEWRWLQDDRGSALYLFADGGFVSSPEERDLRDTFRTFLLGTGVGVRQANRLGILGVEYGIAKGESPLDGRIHVRIDAVF